MKKVLVHNGDLQLVEVERLPATAKKIAPEPFAYGEKSGHIHIVTGKNVEYFRDGNTFYVSVGDDGAKAEHIHQSQLKGYDVDYGSVGVKADHNPSILAPNKVYKAGIHKRYNPFTKLMQNTLD